jgi:hypothetical protein
MNRKYETDGAVMKIVIIVGSSASASGSQGFLPE